MKHFALAATALTVAAGTAQAGGLDRSYTPIDMIFEKGNYAELSFGYVQPSISGVDNASTVGLPANNSISNIAGEFGLASAGVKLELSEKLSFTLIYDQPYGAETRYGGNPATTMLGGTSADAETHALTALLKYQATDRISVYGGPRSVKANGNITLSGLAYGGFNGYNVNFSSDTGYGYVVGGAYEIPDIAFRAALTYHSAVDLSMVATESFPAAVGGPVGTPLTQGVTETETPQSIELAVQSGIAKDTLLFGSVRWSEWSAFSLTPPGRNLPTGLPLPAPQLVNAPGNLASLDDTITYEIGVGRRFTDKFSGSFSISYEAGGSDNLVSPLAPTNGQTAFSIGGKYQFNDSVSLSGGIRYTMFGNALPETGTPDTARGSFSDNDAFSAGLKLGFHF
ncbi:MAG: OmpP1/FadL family transporter [Roseovarius sp.]